MDKPLWGLRVQAPLGARVPSFVCCAPNDGFSPQSGLVQRGVLYAACGGRKTVQPPWRARKCILLWWLAPPPCPVGSMSLDSRVVYSSPMNPVPLPPPQFGGATKGKRLNGQARRLTSPHLEVLCRTSTGDNNPCLLQSRLRREASRCFILPPEQGAVRRSRIGGGERSEPISRMLTMPYDTESKSRNADFMFIARKGDTTTLGPKGRQT